MFGSKILLTCLTEGMSVVYLSGRRAEATDYCRRKESCCIWTASCQTGAIRVPDGKCCVSV